MHTLWGGCRYHDSQSGLVGHVLFAARAPQNDDVFVPDNLQHRLRGQCSRNAPDRISMSRLVHEALVRVSCQLG